jgi:predicted enzyme related to lactoylglutathione lyase
VVKLYRVTVPVEDLERAVAFYGGLFAETGERVCEDWHYFNFGELAIALHETPLSGLQHANAEPLYFAVDIALVNLQERARKLGGRDIDHEIGLLPTGERGFTLLDPDGNRLCLVDAATRGWRPMPPKPREPKAIAVMSLQRDFINAVKGGEFARVRELLLIDPDLCYSVDSAGVSALMLAIYKRHAAVAEFLLQRHEHLSVWEAAALGLTARLAEIIGRQAGLAIAYSVDGFTPIGLSAFFGHPANVSLLLAKGADVNAPTRNSMRVQPLHSALAHDDPMVSLLIAETLLGQGADVHARQHGGYTALHQAADRGNLALVDLLLAAGADSALRADNGRTAADIAALRGHRHLENALGGRTRAAA